MGKLFRVFDNIRIRRKFVLVYMLCICLPVVTGAIVWSSFTAEEMQQNTEYYLKQTFGGATSDFYFLTQTAVDIGRQISADRKLFQDLSTDFSTPAEHYGLYLDALRSRFEMYLVGNTDIAEISLYMDNPHFLNTDYFRVLDDAARRTEWYRMSSESEAEVVAYPASTAIAVVPYKNRITVIRKFHLSDFLDGATNYLLIEMKLDRVIEKLNTDNERLSTYLTAPGDIVVWGVESADSGTSVPVPELPNDNAHYVLQSELGQRPLFDGWQITGVYDRGEIYRRQFLILLYILIITLSLSMLTLVVIWPVLNSMRRRISALADHMRNMREDHLEPLLLVHPGKDEVGWLITAFNNMIAEINGLINDVYKLEVQKKDMEVETLRAEYKYLQAQVDPHFLFNTLNAILVFCYKNGYTELTAVISNLSKLLKRLLTSGMDLVPVREEIDFVDRYLAIEKFRFGDKFTYEIRLAPELAQSERLIPKMCIQPIVENACKHGLQSSPEDNRKLFLTADLDDEGALVIAVEDNGTGMSSRKVDAIWEGIESADEGANASGMGAGVGLRNVYRRMMMHFGDRFHFTIRSEPQRGTEIILRIEEL